MEPLEIIVIVVFDMLSAYALTLLLKVVFSGYPERAEILVLQVRNLAFDRYFYNKVLSKRKYELIKETAVIKDMVIPGWKFYLNPFKWTVKQAFYKGKYKQLMKIKLYLEVL